MANVSSMADMRREQDDKKKGSGKGTDSYTGGEKSGLAVFNPTEDKGDKGDDFSGAERVDGPPPEGTQQVTLYADGFTINDGPFRATTDPKNKKFLDDIKRGQCPEELQEGSAAPVHLAVVDKRKQKYEAGKPIGQAMAPANKPIVPGQADMSAGSTAGPVATGTGTVTVDSDKPVTQIQIRFGDGRRQVQQFNEDQTVGDLFSFIQQCTGTADFRVIEGFPPKPVVDKTKTLKEAGLLKGSVTVKS